MRMMIFLTLTLLLLACQSQNAPKRIRIVKAKQPPLLSATAKKELRLPQIAFLDSVCDAHSDLFYAWDEKSIVQEKNAPNQEDLAVKVNRKLDFTYEGKAFTLYPFFRKDRMMSVHFLLTEKDDAPDKFGKTGFFDLFLVEKEEPYYYQK